MSRTVETVVNVMDPVLRLAAVGCGRVFERYHLPAIRAAEGVGLVGACDVDRRRRAWAESALGPTPCFETVEELLDQVDAQAVLVATPPASHAATLESCLAGGRSVLVEKPMTRTLDEAQRVLRSQRESNATVRVGFNRRFRDRYAGLRRQALRLDGLSHVSFTFISDARRWNPLSSEVSSAEQVLHDAGSHAMDLVRHVAGRSIRSVCAESPDPVCGARLVYIRARLDGGIDVDCTVGHAPRYEEWLSIAADGRTLSVDVSGRSATGRLRTAADLALRRLSGRPTPTDASFRAQLAAFAAACRGRAEDIGADARAGYDAVAAVEACIESLGHSGVWCDLANLQPKGGGDEHE